METSEGNFNTTY
jgi:cation-transporting ATPase 13A1